jgi:hypothetical protein
MGISDVLEDTNTLVLIAVVGVVGLLVLGVIAVVGFAVVGTFVMETGMESGVSGPQASFSVGESGGEVTISHDGGDAVTAEKLLVKVGDETKSWAERGSSGMITEGDTLTVSAESGTTVELIYDGEERVTLVVYTVQ